MIHICKHKIIDKDKIKISNVISDREWLNSFDFFRSEAEYQVDSKCNSGCVLFYYHFN